MAVTSLVLATVAFTEPAGAATGTITEFTTPTAYSSPGGMTAGPDGNVWFTELSGGKIGRITPSGTVTEFPVPTVSNIWGITTGPDGNLWFTEVTSDKVGRITPTGTVTEFALPTASSQPAGITAGPDGNFWFAENAGNKIGRITPSGTVTEFPVPTALSRPEGITAGFDGNLWFTENGGNKVGRITPTGHIDEFPIPTAASAPAGITLGPDGDPWFTELGGKIGRIDWVGDIVEYTVPTVNSEPFGITTGHDHNLWFTELGGNRVGRITPSGTVTEFPVPAFNSSPREITSGADGNVWFTESSSTSNKVGRVEVDLPVAVVSPTSVDFGNQNLGTTSASQTVTLSNTGNAPLLVSGLSKSGMNIGDYATASDGCTGQSIAAGSSCTVTVTFTPTGTGTRTATLAFNDNAAGSQQAALTGTGVAAPVAAVSPTSVDYGNQSVGTTSTARTVTLSNTGNAPLLVSSTSVFGTNTGDFTETSDTCTGQSIAAGSSCTVTLTFTPLATGTRTATLAFSDNAADSPQQSTLTGTGVAAPVAAVSPSSVDFGNQSVGTTSASRTVTLSNTGNAPLLVSSTSVFGTNTGDFTEASDNCTGQSIAAGSSCTVTLTFTPTGTGTRTATLAFSDNAADSPQQSALTGTGVAQADLAVALSATPNPVKTNQTITYTVTVTNHGPNTASGLHVNNTLPTGAQYSTLRTPAGWTCTTPPVGSTGTIGCTSPSLASGAVATFTITAKVVASGKVNITDTATVTGSTADPNTANNTATVSTAVRGAQV